MTATGYLANLAACLATVEATDSLDAAMYACDLYLQTVRKQNGVVHLVGNGGSAAIVAHAQNDFVKGCDIRALVYQDVPTLTAYSNDIAYENAYAEPLGLWLQPQDVVIVVSSSGESANILNAAVMAMGTAAAVITMSGFGPSNQLRQLGDLNFYVPSSDYGQVELTHAALLHCLTDRLAHAG